MLPWGKVVGAFIGLTVLTVAGAEAGVGLRGSSARLALYAGGAGALFAAVCGLPFVAKLAALRDSKDDAKFWQIWAAGLLTRSGIAGLAAMLLLLFAQHADAGVVLLALVHFVALMLETIWAASRLTTDTRK
jgi:hypothetical protein